MKYLKLLFYCLFYYLSPAFLFCEVWGNPNMTVKSVRLTDSPLSFNSVYRIYQDREGFVWFGSKNGICRYDAYQNITFRSDLNTPGLLTNNEINCFQETNNGYLIIGTEKGLNLLNKSDCRIMPFTVDRLDQKAIRCMCSTNSGDVWIGTDSLFYRFSSDLSSYTAYQSPTPYTHPSNFMEDKEGRLWITCWTAGLFLFDKDKGSFISYPPIGKHNNPFKLFQDNTGQLWLCSWEDGIFLFNPDGKKEEEMYIPLPFTKEDGNTENTFFSIVQDDINHYIWVMSMAGLHAFRYDTDGKLVKVDVSGLFTPYNKIFSEVIKDRSGNLWIATYGEGALTLHFNQLVVENLEIPAMKEKTGITTHISAIYEDKEGLLWIQQDRHGLAFYDSASEEVRFYTDYASLRNLGSLKRVSCITDFRSVPDEIWVGAENTPRIYCLKKKGNEVVLSRQIDLTAMGGKPCVPSFFYEDNKNNIWIATDEKLLIKPHNTDSIAVFPFSFTQITGITEDTRGNLWVGCKHSGVFCLSFGFCPKEQPQVTHYSPEQGNFPSNNIEAIHADFNGKVWISTKEGHFLAFDIVAKELEDLSRNLGVGEENMLSIISDDYGYVWVATNARIIRYNPSDKSLWFYSEAENVLVDYFVARSFFKSKSGKLYFGGNRGISLFTPSHSFPEKIRNPKALITNVKINNRSVFRQKDNNKFNLLTQKLQLDPGDTNIEIYFSTLDYSYPSKIRYAYKMEGIDKEWVYPENNRRFAIYSQLSKGYHSFLLRATDENNLWSDHVSQLHIYKRPAFGESNLAYLLYFLLFLTVSWFSFRIIRNRLRLRQELQIAQMEKNNVEELTQTKLRYFTNISHDFLTPLTLISCLVDNMENTQDESQSIHLATIRSNVNRLKRLLQQILDFRKMESDNMSLLLSFGDIALFIKDSCYMHFLPLMDKKEMNFSFKASPLQIFACFDADKVDKIVFNLLSNAFKYTPEKGNVEICLECRKEGEHSFLYIEVKDSGVGIAPEGILHIFTRFYNNKTSRASETNGIGLSLTKELVELHHGTIRVESRLGEGSSFIVVLPVDEASYSEPALERLPLPAAKVKDDEASVSLVGESISILVVEDNEELLHIMAQILPANYKVCTASNGLEALEILAENKIDIIISDVMMPGMDGLEFCRILKKDLITSHIPVILLTARSSTSDRIDCYNAGADAYISKPFELNVLAARINNFISNKKRKQQQFQSDVEINIATLEYPSLDEEFLTKAVQVIEDNLSEFDFDVNAFAEALNLSKSSLYRKIKTMTGMSPVEFIKNIKLKRACRMLRNTSLSIADVAFAVGFSDPKYFATCFKSEFGLTPRNYQKSPHNQRL
ncbi:MAG: response regulator [Tannerellaceae bacterium]|jgi:signal transduction histidine kinase/ligand-binding sensor domain-containing protein/DNA-binding response OmpR family regulator|nr:response regulator [Tannerellaceae bacterium]